MLLRPQDIEAAQSTADLRKDPWHRDPRDNYADIMERLGQLGYRLVRKLRVEPGAGWATTLPFVRQIRLPTDWQSRSFRTRTAILGHELVHAEQDLSVVRYAAPRYRWKVEVPAWRESFRIWHAHDPLLDVAKAMDGVTEKLREFYGIDDPRALLEARRIWMMDW